MREHDDEFTTEAKKAPERADAAAERGGPTAELLRLQRLAGNRGVTAMLSKDHGHEDGEREADPAASVSAALDSGGKPLGDDVREDMEGRLGHDFSDVRVHTGEAATDSAKALGASAYTVGSNVVFQGDWDPASDGGKRTLAHELTHVVQQSSGPVDGTDTGGGLKVSDPGDRFEQEAERSADAAMQRSVAPAGAGTEAVPSVQRQAEAPEEEEEEEMTAQQSVQRQAEGAEEEEEEPPV